MSTVELKKKLIEKIKVSNDERLLEEAWRLLEMEETSFETYKLSDDQKSAVNEAREQIKRGKSLTNEEADQDIDKWLEE